MSLKQVLFGRPLATDEGDEERVGPLAGVPILGLDALASASYGPEALLTVLLPAGLLGLRYMPVLTGFTIALLGVVFVSYRQTIAAYPNGGGAYAVAKENLGVRASLLAAAALALDYLLNAAVAISAGIGALVSALPSLLPYSLSLCLVTLLALTLVNLRGVRATGVAFTLPTYLFVVCLLSAIAIGVFKVATHQQPVVTRSLSVSPGAGGVSAWILLRAFANGCTAMTGVEAVSNGVPIFRKPEVPAAHRTLGLIILILTVLLIGITFVCCTFGLTATAPGTAGYQSIVSQIVAATLGHGALYYISIGSVMAVLALSANTSFAAFPGLCRFLAADKFLPEAFGHRGRRLSFSFGILVLAFLSALLLISFGGVTDALIPLFAVGALLGFTISQIGMVAHWRKIQNWHARRAMWLNGAGALATGATLGVVVVSKFTEGAWLTALLVLGMLVLFRKVRAHYDFITRVTQTTASLEVGPPKAPIAVVPLRHWDAVSLKALRFATRLAPHVVAVQVLTGDRETDDLSSRWKVLVEDPAEQLHLRAPELKVLRSEYRQLFQPLLNFVSELAEQHPERQVAVVIPELVKPRWYHYLLHNHTASMLRTFLLLRGGPQVVIVTTPWYLEDWLPERSVIERKRSIVQRWRARRQHGAPNSS